MTRAIFLKCSHPFIGDSTSARPYLALPTCLSGPPPVGARWVNLRPGNNSVALPTTTPSTRSSRPHSKMELFLQPTKKLHETTVQRGLVQGSWCRGRLDLECRGRASPPAEVQGRGQHRGCHYPRAGHKHKAHQTAVPAAASLGRNFPSGSSEPCHHLPEQGASLPKHPGLPPRDFCITGESTVTSRLPASPHLAQLSVLLV